MNYPQQPAIGSTHNYSLLWNSSQQGYDLMYDGIFIENRPASLTLTRVFSGGEAESPADAIGIAGCLNNQLSNTSWGNWVSYPSHYNNVDTGYTVIDFDADNWQVSGNN